VTSPWTPRKKLMEWNHLPIWDSQIMFLSFSDTCLTFFCWMKTVK
jgi:hypothetical protein